MEEYEARSFAPEHGNEEMPTDKVKLQIHYFSYTLVSIVIIII
jgi:hypothetical protein